LSHQSGESRPEGSDGAPMEDTADHTPLHLDPIPGMSYMPVSGGGRHT